MSNITDGLSYLHHSTPTEDSETSLRPPNFRRLFPQHRSPLLATSSNRISLRPNEFVPPKSDSSIKPESAIDQLDGDDGEYDDNSCNLVEDGSPSSSGTVEFNALPDSFGPVSDATGPSDVAYSPSTLTERSNTPTALDSRFISDKNSWSTVDLESHPEEVSQSSSKETQQRKVRWNPQAELYESGHRSGMKTTRSLPNLRNVSLDSEKESLNYGHFSVAHGNQTRVDDAIHAIESWDMTSTLYTSATISAEGIIQIYHGLRVSVSVSRPVHTTQRISFCLVVRNGPEKNLTRSLPQGQDSIKDIPIKPNPPSSKLHDAEITIIRDLADLMEPINLYFYSTFPSACHDAGATLPTCWPSSGKVLRESVFVTEPFPPLTLQVLPNDGCTTWTTSKQHQVDRLKQFERFAIPMHMPEGLKESISIRLVQPPRARFHSLEQIAASRVAWNMEMDIRKDIDMDIVCYMRLNINALDNAPLLTFNTHGWVPRFSLVAGCLATENFGEWVEDDTGLTLYKQPWMPRGPVQVEMYWDQPPATTSKIEHDLTQLPLPSIRDYRILNGTLAAKDVDGISIANNHIIDTWDDSYRENADSKGSLPLLHPGYSIYIDRIPKELWQPMNGFAEKAEPPEVSQRMLASIGEHLASAVALDPKLVKTAPTTEPSKEPDADKDGGTESKQFIFFLFQFLTIALLIFGCMFKFEPIRRDPIHDEATIAGDRSPSMLGYRRAQEIQGGIYKAEKPVLRHEHTLYTSTEGTNEEIKESKDAGEWRNWIDHALGWSGPPQ